MSACASSILTESRESHRTHQPPRSTANSGSFSAPTPLETRGGGLDETRWRWRQRWIATARRWRRRRLPQLRARPRLQQRRGGASRVRHLLGRPQLAPQGAPAASRPERLGRHALLQEPLPLPLPAHLAQRRQRGRDELRDGADQHGLPWLPRFRVQVEVADAGLGGRVAYALRL